MKDRILLIGASGYLGTYLLDTLVQKYDVTIFKGRVENITHVEKYTQHDFSYIFHFGSPNDDSHDLSNVVQGTRNIIALANQQHAKLIFAGSEAMNELFLNEYGKIKKQLSFEIQQTADKYINLIIPRIYSPDRNHGLIKAIKDSKPLDLDKVMKFLTPKQFVTQTLYAMKLNKINYRYKDLHLKSIQEIKDWILNSPISILTQNDPYR